MKIKRKSVQVGSAALLACALAIPSVALAAKRIVFGGGPAGGTFQVVANSIQTYDPVKDPKNTG
jgi:uncharacterized protein